MSPVEIPVGNGAVAAEVAGSGMAVVLVHGFSLDRRMWDPQWSSLRTRFRVVRYDMRGFGASTPARSPHSHLDDLLAVLSAVDAQPAHLVGLSLGANVALAAAACHPERVGRLVLASPGLPGYPWSTPRPPDEAAAYAAEHGIRAAKRFWLDHPMFASARRYPEVWATLRMMIDDFPALQWIGESKAAALPDVSTRLGMIGAPTLVVNGEADVPGYLEIGAELAERIPDARRVVFPGAGHMAPMERCAEFTALTLGFLAPPIPQGGSGKSRTIQKGSQ